MLPEDDRDKIIEQQKRAIKKSLQGSKFENAPMVCVAAAVGGEKVAAIQPQGKAMMSRWVVLLWETCWKKKAV